MKAIIIAAGKGSRLGQLTDDLPKCLLDVNGKSILQYQLDAYQENATLIDEIVKEEGEKIISWILNLINEECKYEDLETVRREWEELASPEIVYLENHWEISDDEDKTSIMTLIKDFKKKTGVVIPVEQMKNALENQGYAIKFNVIQNIKENISGIQEKLAG